MKFLAVIQDGMASIGVAMQMIPYFAENSPMANSWILILALLIIRIEISIQRRPTTIRNKSKSIRSKDEKDLPKLSWQVSSICCGNNNPEKIRILRRALLFRSQFHPPKRRTVKNLSPPTSDDTPTDDAELISLFQYYNKTIPHTSFRSNIGQDKDDAKDNHRTNRENNNNNNNNNNPWVFFKFIVAWCFSLRPEQDREELLYFDLLVHCAVATIWLFQTTTITKRKYTNTTSSNNSSCGCGLVSVEVHRVWIEELVLHSRLRGSTATSKHTDSIEIDAYRRCARRVLEYLQLIGLVGPEEVAEQIVDESSIPTTTHTRTHYCQLKWNLTGTLMNGGLDNNVNPTTHQTQQPQQHFNTAEFDLKDDGIVIYDSSCSSIENQWRYCWTQRLGLECENMLAQPKPQAQTGLSRYIYMHLPYLCTQNRSYVKTRRLLESHDFCQGRLATLGIENGIQQHVKDYEQLVVWVEQGLMVLDSGGAIRSSMSDGSNNNHSKDQNGSIYSGVALCLHEQKATRSLDVLGNAYFSLGMSYIRLGNKGHGGSGGSQQQNSGATAVAALEMFEHADSVYQKALEEWCCLEHQRGCSSIAQSLFNLSLVYKVRKQKEHEDMCTKAELQFGNYCHSPPNSSKDKTKEEQVLQILLQSIQTACHVYNESPRDDNHQKEDNGLSLYYDALRHTLHKSSHICWLKVQTVLSIYNICADPRYLKEILILLDVVEVVGTTVAKSYGNDVTTETEYDTTTLLSTLESARDLAIRIQRLL